MSRPYYPERVLALDPFHRGMGFVVLEGKDRLVDWGVRRLPGVYDASMKGGVRMLIERYQPAIIVMENLEGEESRRGVRARKALQGVERMVTRLGLAVGRSSVTQVQLTFGKWVARTKEERVQALVQRFPVLGLYRPPYRKPWMSEDPRMSIFDALAFAITYREESQRSTGL